MLSRLAGRAPGSGNRIRLGATVRVARPYAGDQLVVAWAQHDAPPHAGQLPNVVAEWGALLWAHTYARMLDTLGPTGCTTAGRMLRLWFDAHRGVDDLTSPGLAAYASGQTDFTIELSPALPRGKEFELRVELRAPDGGEGDEIYLHERGSHSDDQVWIALVVLLELTIQAAAEPGRVAMFASLDAFGAAFLGKDPPRERRVRGFFAEFAPPTRSAARPFRRREPAAESPPDPPPANDHALFRPRGRGEV